MKGIKLDRYAIYEKGREYEVLVFPFIKYMWVFDGGPAEDGLYISGSEYSYAMLRYVFALLASDPGKLVFFPCRQPGVEGMFEPNYHLVLYRPELQFRRSLWVKIKKKIDRKNWKGKRRMITMKMFYGKNTDARMISCPTGHLIRSRGACWRKSSARHSSCRQTGTYVTRCIIIRDRI